MGCYLASAFVIANLMWLVPAPQMCSGMSDYDECMYMADVGCTMVEECSEGTELEEDHETCYERASLKCEKFKEKKDESQSSTQQVTPPTQGW